VIASATPFSIGFLLIDGFALMSCASATEPLRAANLLAGEPLFRTEFYSLAGGPVRSSGAAMFETRPLPPTTTDLDVLFVVAGGDPARTRLDAKLLGALRRYGRSGLTLGGISAGPFYLAAAGLLRDRRFTLHWEHLETFAEQWPDLHPERVRFVIDRDRITCGGGVAPLDLMHALIAARHGTEFAQKVSDWFLHTQVGEPAGPQRAAIHERYQVHNKALARVLEKMEASIEHPLGRAEMAEFAGISERHLDRLFAAELAIGFKAEYLGIRLRRARSLLRQSTMSVSEIAFATGFSTPSQF
jgi:transcriptional regulator GlxA family with amidase domain